MIIKKAKKQDLKKIAEIFWIESSKAPYNRKRPLKRVIKIIENDFKTGDIYIAILDKKIVGFTIVEIDSGIKNKLWINDLWLLKEYQKMGIGKQIMDFIEKLYKKKGIKRFELVADTEKGGAVGFYKEMGYVMDDSLVFMKKER